MLLSKGDVPSARQAWNRGVPSDTVRTFAMPREQVGLAWFIDRMEQQSGRDLAREICHDTSPRHVR